MMVTHFNRGPRPGNYTFEQLFRCLRAEMQNSIQVISRDVPIQTNLLEAIFWAKRNAGAINHITGDVHYLAFGLPSDSTMITVHDLGHFSRTLKGWKQHVYKQFWLKGPFQKANRLTAISHFTKNEMIGLLQVPPEKITVIPNPVLPGFSYTPILRHSDKATILQIGSGHNKNVSRLIAAAQGLPVKLLLVNKLFDSKIRRQLEQSGLEYEQRIDLDLAGLIQAYRDSDILFFASEYEGFGMPVIEAQAIGRPVITSNITSMPEVAGPGGALLVDPFDTQDIRTAIISLLNDQILHDRLVSTGLENVKNYSISHIAQLYLNLYQTI